MNMIKSLPLYLLPLLLAFSAMVVVNEYARGTISESRRGTEVMKMNSAVATPDACTWKCFNDTIYCKQHHVKLMSGYFIFIDPLYFGMITLLMLMGHYGAANVLFLVFLWPLLMSYLLVKPLMIEFRIRELRKRHV